MLSTYNQELLHQWLLRSRVLTNQLAITAVRREMLALRLWRYSSIGGGHVDCTTNQLLLQNTERPSQRRLGLDGQAK